MTKYLIDTNVFVEAIDRFQCVGFLEWVEAAHKLERAGSVHAVYTEIKRVNEVLYEWKIKNSDIFLESTSRKVSSAIRKVVDWAERAGRTEYTRSSVKEFNDKADHILVGHAHGIGSIVVTQESKYEKEGRKVLKIPNACEALGVKWMTAEEMLEEEQPEFFKNCQRHSVL